MRHNSIEEELETFLHWGKFNINFLEGSLLHYSGNHWMKKPISFRSSKYDSASTGGGRLYQQIKVSPRGRVYRTHRKKKRLDYLLHKDKIFQLDMNNQRVSNDFYRSNINNLIYHISVWEKGDYSEQHANEELEAGDNSKLYANMKHAAADYLDYRSCANNFNSHKQRSYFGKIPKTFLINPPQITVIHSHQSFISRLESKRCIFVTILPLSIIRAN